MMIYDDFFDDMMICITYVNDMIMWWWGVEKDREENRGLFYWVVEKGF